MVRAAINLIPEQPIARMVELAVHAEALGYQRCWVYDEGLATRDVYVTLAAIAGATDRLGLGPGITNPYTRHPATTAGAIAALDELSGGRAFLGIGAGGSLTLDPLGIRRDRPLTAVGETIAACRSLFSGQTTDIRGTHLTLQAARLDPSRPDTEIWLAGRGARMLALGGRTCDGVMLDFIHKPDLGRVIGRIREAGRATGNEPRISYSTMVITDEGSLEATKPHMTYRLVDSPEAVKEAIGLSPGDTERIRNAMADGLHAAGAHVRDEWVHPFVISGSPEACAAELADLVDRHGIDEFLLPVLNDRNAEELMGAIAPILGR
ncbi:MAG: LLM class flavin-dependent oxidoreductase [Actinomycetia bacterium]|nr:LLM class flavin-dependent oxidoreductase [Actinomycetes bacterium]